MNTIHFEEKQRFKLIAVYVLLGILQVLFLWGLVRQVILNEPWGTKPASGLALVIINAGLFLLILFFRSINLKTVINDRYISFRFFPLQTKTKLIYWNEIKDISITEYNGIKDFWGFGLRFMPGKGWCYTLPGHSGIRLTLTNKKKILIGTHKPKEIAKILNDLKIRGIINITDRNTNF